MLQTFRGVRQAWMDRDVKELLPEFYEPGMTSRFLGIVRGIRFSELTDSSTEGDAELPPRELDEAEFVLQ